MSLKFNKDSFWEKTKLYATAIGCKPLCLAFKLFYALDNPKIPKWAKNTIYSALAYLVLPVDAIPDFLPVAGYSDDLSVLAAAVAAVSMFIDDNAVTKAREHVKKLFKSCEC